MKLRLHAWEPASRANGPGLRAVVWLQGCTLACPGCFNPGAQDARGGFESDVESLALELLSHPELEGVSISGGEPFQQPEALAQLLARLRPAGLSTLVFTGYTSEALRTRPHGPRILSLVDVLVAGPYRRELHLGAGLLGSSNQRLHLLTPRYRPADFAALPPCEVILHRDGSVTISGFQGLARLMEG